jgi:hypothetical protein
MLKEFEKVSEAASGLSKVGWVAGKKGYESLLIRGIDIVSGGYVPIPDDPEAAIGAGHEYVGAWQDANKAVKAARD